MANALYPRWKAVQLGANAIDLLGADIRAVLVDLDEYTYSAAHNYLDDVPGAARIAVSPALANKAIDADTAYFNSDDPIFAAVTGAELEAIILYHHTGNAATSRLIAFFDTGVTGLPLTPDGSDVRIVVDSDGWFGL